MSALAIEVVSGDQLGTRSAQRIAADLRDALDVRGRATLALSGGSTPVPMYAELARADLPWDLINVFQVDERIAPDDDPERNIIAIRAALVDNGPVPEHHLRAMHVVSVDVETEADRYGAFDSIPDGAERATGDRRGAAGARSRRAHGIPGAG